MKASFVTKVTQCTEVNILMNSRSRYANALKNFKPPLSNSDSIEYLFADPSQDVLKPKLGPLANVNLFSQFRLLDHMTKKSTTYCTTLISDNTVSNRLSNGLWVT